MTKRGSYDKILEMEYEVIISAFMDIYSRVPDQKDLAKIQTIIPAANNLVRYLYYDSKKLGTIEILKGRKDVVLMFEKE